MQRASACRLGCRLVLQDTDYDLRCLPAPEAQLIINPIIIQLIIHDARPRYTGSAGLGFPGGGENSSALFHRCRTQATTPPQGLFPSTRLFLSHHRRFAPILAACCSTASDENIENFQGQRPGCAISTCHPFPTPISTPIHVLCACKKAAEGRK